MLFVTLTAPSFGAVHSRREHAGRPRPCRQHPGGRCRHGNPRTCHAVHQPGDPQLGEALCPGCFDYPRAVLWNALATELWRRTTIGISRALAARTGTTIAALSATTRLSYIKVVEYQRRGVVHLHVVARLDGPTGPDSTPPFPGALLEAAIHQAATAARVPYPTGSALPGTATWGREIDVRPITTDIARPEAVAAYIAKYATKSTDGLGRLDHKLTAADLAALDLPPHLARMVTTAWDLGGRPELADLHLRDWAHTLGFRGHWLTKSRRYSTTFSTLRDARAAWTSGRHEPAVELADTTVLKNWRYIGRGWANPGDAWLAETAATEHAEARHHAREARKADTLPHEL